MQSQADDYTFVSLSSLSICFPMDSIFSLIFSSSSFCTGTVSFMSIILGIFFKVNSRCVLIQPPKFTRFYNIVARTFQNIICMQICIRMQKCIRINFDSSITPYGVTPFGVIGSFLIPYVHSA